MSKGDGEPVIMIRTRAEKLQLAAECYDKGVAAKQKGRHDGADAWKAAGDAWTAEAEESG